MPKIATTTLNLSEYRMVDGFYVRNGFSLVQDKYCTETGLPIFVNKRANGKWGYCDNEGTDFYVEWVEEADDEDSDEEEEDSEFMCELIDCITCKRPTMRKDMYWKHGGCVMTEFCEPCHKAKIPDDMMVVPRYMFENEKGEKVKWCLCVMKL